MTQEAYQQANEFYTFHAEKGLEGDALLEKLQAEAEQARHFGHTDLADALEDLMQDTGDTIIRRLTTSRGDVVETHLTDEEALEILREKMKWSEFAMSLVAQADAPRSKKRNQPTITARLSSRQWPWVHKLAIEQLARDEKKAAEQARGPVLFSHLPELFQHALDSGHKTPRITLDMDEGRVRLSVAGPNSRTPGAIHVTDGGPFGSNTYYGRVGTDGVFRGRSTPEWVMEVLRKLDGETLAFVVAYGQKTGNCCFCNSELVTTESVTAGYGPICAERYNLPWG